MKRSNPTLAGLIVFVLFFFLSCDTSDKIDLPDYFVKYFGDAGSQEGVDLIANSDGTILLFGNTTPVGETNTKLYLAKCDDKGNLLWELPPFGGSGNNQAKDIELTSDGRIVLLANSDGSAGENDILIITMDQDGVELNRNLFSNDGNEDASTVTQTSDGFIVTGSTSNTNQKANPVENDQRDAFNFRFYDDLTPFPDTWNKTLGPGTFDAGVKVIEVSTGQFYFFGYTNKRPAGQSTTNFNFWIFPLNNVGNGSFDIGEEIFAGDPLVDERLSSVALSPSQSGEGFLLTGMRTDAAGNGSIYISKLRKNLNFSAGETDQVFQFPSTTLSADINLGQLSDSKTASISSILSGFLIVSNEHSADNENLYLTKITNTGSNAWSGPKGFVFGGDGIDQIGSVAELADGSILLIGTFSIGDDGQHKVALIKVNKDGKFND
jgi:hypothetical protein